MDKIIRQGLQFHAGFDKKSEQEMRATVEQIIAGATHLDFNTPENRKSLQALVSVFRDMFESVGNKKIDFAQMLNLPGPEMFDAFKRSANEMANVWADVVSRMGENGLRNVFMKDERSLSDALDRLTKNGKLVENRLKNIKQAFKDVKSTDINKLLNDALGAEVNFNTAETWEERTAAALRYIKVRDKIMSVKSSGSFDINDVDRNQLDFFKNITDSEHRLGAYFVRDLKEVVPEMQTSLNNIFNLYRKVEIDVVPKVVKVLDVSDILGGKRVVKVDAEPEINDDAIDADFKQKLEALHDAYQNAQHRLAGELESNLLSNLPEELRKALQDKLRSVLSKSVLKDADYDNLWSEFKTYAGTGTGTGTGTGGGSEFGAGGGSGQTYGATTEEVQNLEAVRAKVAEVTSAVELKTKAFTDEAAAVNTAVESEIQQLGELETKVKSISETLAVLLSNIKNGENDLSAGLSNIVVNVNNTKSAEGETSGVNQEILNQILNNTYAVKIKSDTSDENANKLDINTESLEGSLKKVFAHILREPTTPTENTQEPWALDKTLLSVKETLDQIRTNTTPIVESNVPVQPKSTLPETRLGEIKELLSQINGKIVKGTKAGVSGTNKTSNTKTTQKPLNTAYSQEKKDIQKLSLRKFRTELEESGRLTDDLRKKMNTLSRSLGQVKDGQALAKWNERFKQFKLETDIGSIKDKYKDKKVVSSYKELIDVQKIRNSLEVQYEKARDGSKLKQYYKDQIADIDQIIAKQKIRKKNVEQEAKLAAMQTEQDRKLGAIRISKEDTIRREQEARRQSDAEAKARDAETKRQLDLKQKEAEVVRELIDLWEQLGRAKANGDAVEEARLRQEINGKRSGLTSVDYATNMKFKHAKEKGFNSAVGAQDAAALSEQQKKMQRLAALYRELGAAEAKLGNATEGTAAYKAIDQNIAGLWQQIKLEGDLDDVLQKQLETIKRLSKEKTKRALVEANGRKSLRDEIALNKKQASANKVTSSSRAGRDILFTATTFDFDVLEKNAEVKELLQSLERLDVIEQRLADNHWEMNEDDSKDLAKATGEVNRYTEAVKLLVNSARMFGDDNSINLNRNIGAGDIKAQLLDAANAAHGAEFRFEEFDDELQTITGTLKVGPREFRKVTIGVNQFTGAIRESQGALKKTETFIQSFKRKLSEISSYFSASSVIFKAVNELKKGIQYVRDIDLALTELKKVTDETEETYAKFLDTAAKTADKVGSTIQKVVSSTADWARLNI